MNNFLFIGGHPKSGTTLLLSLLDNHPELCVFPEELKWYTQVVHIKNPSEKKLFILSKSGAYVPRLGKVDFPSGTRDYTHINSSEYFADLTIGIIENISNADLLLHIYDNWKKHNNIIKNVKWNVEKTPGNEHYIDLFLDDFPESKMIYILRDPRDNFYSYKKKHPKLTIDKFCKRWNNSVNEIKYRENIYVLRYEDLVNKTEKKMKEICQYLNIEFHKSLLVPTRGGESWSGNSMFGENDPNKVHKYSTKERWRKLSPIDIDDIETDCYDNMNRYDYKLTYKRRKISSKIKQIIIKNISKYVR